MSALDTRANQKSGMDFKTGPAREFVPSTRLIYESVLGRIEDLMPRSVNLRHLDIGAGNGLLLKEVRERFSAEQSACDYSGSFMKYSDVPLDLVDLDSQSLPYPDSSFDLITCLETVEHLENFRALFVDPINWRGLSRARTSQPHFERNG
jgi:2-polyprenyl-3-methyl-5-hydroxy-6-metoxy-1,4-benzoquinol methylase